MLSVHRAHLSTAVSSHRAYISTPLLTDIMQHQVKVNAPHENHLACGCHFMYMPEDWCAQDQRPHFLLHSPSRILTCFLSAAAPARVPVLVVGAGPTGLTLSTLLGKLGIPNLVLDAASSLPNHPQVTHPCDCFLLSKHPTYTLASFVEAFKAAIYASLVMW